MNRPESVTDHDRKHSSPVAPASGGGISTDGAEAMGDFISPEHEAEYRAFVEEHPDLEAVEFLIVDPNGVIRGKWAPGDSLKKAFQEGSGASSSGAPPHTDDDTKPHIDNHSRPERHEPIPSPSDLPPPAKPPAPPKLPYVELTIGGQ